MTSSDIILNNAETGRRWLTAEKLARIERLHKSGYNYAEIGIRVGHNRDVIRKIVIRGFGPKARQDPSPPSDFALYASDETMTELQRRYRRGNRTINRWLREKGIARPNMHRAADVRPCPADFAALAPSLTFYERARHWNAARPTVLRWCKECGIRTPRSDMHERRKAADARSEMLASWKPAS